MKLWTGSVPLNTASAKVRLKASKFERSEFENHDFDKYWKSYLMDLPPNDDGNKNITSFSEAMNKDLSEDERR